jgi:hypothetical protein
VKGMNFWLVRAIAIATSFSWQGRIIKRSAKLLISLLLILSLSGCGGKVVSQEPFTSGKVRDNPQLTNQISEVSPPSVIQELKRRLETNQPQVKIISPKPDETLENDKVDVSFQVKDLPIFQDSQYKLGSHLHVILDNQPYIAVYDISQPLTLSNLAAGTHTLRVFASYPWYESFKNEGAYAQTTFHVFTKTDENNPDTSQPLLTYSHPKGEYGAEPILLDFYLTNAPLQIGGKDILKDEIGDWRIRCTINGESFVLDRWESVYLKGFKPGKNWVKLEFLDGDGKVIKNIFNTTVGSINYEPKGKDTLSKIIRGELSAQKVSSITDPNYTVKIPVLEPIPTIEPTVKPTLETQSQDENSTEENSQFPKIEIPEIQAPVEKPKVELRQPEKLKSDDSFKHETDKPSLLQPNFKETPELTPSETPITPKLIPEIIDEAPISETNKSPTEKPKFFGKYFKYPDVNAPVETNVDKSVSPFTITPSQLLESPKSPTPEVAQPPKKQAFTKYFKVQTVEIPGIPNNQPIKQPDIPNVIESPTVQAVPTAITEVTPVPIQHAKSRLSKYLQNPQVTPKTKQEVPDKLDEKESPIAVEAEVKVTPGVNQNAKSNVLIKRMTNQLDKIKSSQFLQRLELANPASSDTTIPTMDKSSDAQANGES